MKTNTNFQIVKNTILGNPTFGKKPKKNEFLIAFRSCIGPIYQFMGNDNILNDMVRDILKYPVLSNVSLSEPLPEQAIIRLVESLIYHVSKKNK